MCESLEEAVDNLSRCDFGTALQVIAGTEMMHLIIQETSADRIVFYEDTKRWPGFRPLGSVAKAIQHGMPTNAIPPVAFDFTQEDDGIISLSSDQREAALERLYALVRNKALRAAGEMLDCIEQSAEPDPRRTRKAVYRRMAEDKANKVQREADLKHSREQLHDQRLARGL